MLARQGIGRAATAVAVAVAASASLRRCHHRSSHIRSAAAAAGGGGGCIFFTMLAWQYRAYGSRSAADGYLIELLNTEIEQEHRQHRLPPQGIANEDKITIVGPFQLIDKPGMEDVLLKRTVGTEQIEIICMLEKQYPEEEDEEEEQRLQHKHSHHYNKSKASQVEDEPDEIVEVLHLSVNMKKGEVTLELDCSFVRGAREVMIEYVVLHESNSTKLVGQPEPYGGPIFEDLDEDLQRAFHELVKARGLSVDVARYMMDYMSNKESTEYVRWLHKLKSFFTC